MEWFVRPAVGLPRFKSVIATTAALDLRNSGGRPIAQVGTWVSDANTATG